MNFDNCSRHYKCDKSKDCFNSLIPERNSAGWINVYSKFCSEHCVRFTERKPYDRNELPTWDEVMGRE